MEQPKKEVFLGRVINTVMLVFFPIWWLVPSAIIVGDTAVSGKNSDLGISSIIVVAYNLLYPFVFYGICDREGGVYGPVYSCEEGWRCEAESITILPPKHDLGYGLSIWLRVIPAIIILGVARLVGWIFFPLLSLYALLCGLGILLALTFVSGFVLCVAASVFSD